MSADLWLWITNVLGALSTGALLVALAVFWRRERALRVELERMKRRQRQFSITYRVTLKEISAMRAQLDMQSQILRDLQGEARTVALVDAIARRLAVPPNTQVVVGPSVPTHQGGADFHGPTQVQGGVAGHDIGTIQPPKPPDAEGRRP